MMRQKTAEKIRDGNGWFWPVNSRKAHYYDETKTSVCGKWAIWAADPEFDSFDSPKSPDDCAACRKRVDDAHQALEATNG